MATRFFTGGSPLIGQVNSVTPGGTIEATDTFTVTIGTKSITVTATLTTVAHVVALLRNAIAASTEPEWREVQATDMTTHLELTARTPGRPFTQTSSVSNVSGGAAPTLVTATTTAASGPELWSAAANWSGETAPAGGDVAIIEGAHKIRFGLGNDSITLAELTLRDFTGEIGLPPTNREGKYPEYRDQFLKISATVINVMESCKAQLVRIDVGSNPTTVNVLATGAPLAPTIPALCLLGSDSTNVGNFVNGSVGVATEAGESAEFASIKIGAGAQLNVEIGAGCTLGTLEQSGGACRLGADCVATVHAGELRVIGDVSISLTIGALGTVVVNGAAAIDSLIINGGKLDATKDVRPFTVDSADEYAGANIDDRYGRATWTNGINLHCDHDQVTNRFGPGKNVEFNKVI